MSSHTYRWIEKDNAQMQDSKDDKANYTFLNHNQRVLKLKIHKRTDTSTICENQKQHNTI